VDLRIVRAEAGGFAEFEVRGIESPVHVEGSVGGKIVFAHDCPDPPCHERMRLDFDLAGQRLDVVVVAPSGVKIRRSARIAVVRHDQKREEGMGFAGA
jgi:hypothetical protein